MRQRSSMGTKCGDVAYFRRQHAGRAGEAQRRIALQEQESLERNAGHDRLAQRFVGIERAERAPRASRRRSPSIRRRQARPRVEAAAVSQKGVTGCNADDGAAFDTASRRRVG